uniref:SAM domain-containing protein n=1 Tax=Angiostrongylus cantonensis TaxID=6313 RepID=A0A0K0D827_ANGCA
LDEFGCSLFPNILPHVEYPSDLNGGLLVNAFSLDVDQLKHIGCNSLLSKVLKLKPREY